MSSGIIYLKRRRKDGRKEGMKEGWKGYRKKEEKISRHQQQRNYSKW